MENRSHVGEVHELIQVLGLKPHPEGGFFREVYRSEAAHADKMSPVGIRSVCSHIYYLLTRGTKAKFHVLDSDELFHHYMGGPMTLIELQRNKPPVIVRLGQDYRNGEKICHIIRAGTWFGAAVNSVHEYSLVGCTVSPAFVWEGFKAAERKRLLDLFPQSSVLIEDYYS